MRTMANLVVVLPLKPGSREAAERLLEAGLPFELDTTRFDRHAVYLTEAEVVFVFEGGGASRALDLAAEDPNLLRAAHAWQEIAAGRPRIAKTTFAWERTGPGEGDAGSGT
jgi:hypothetical protein